MHRNELSLEPPGQTRTRRGRLQSLSRWLLLLCSSRVIVEGDSMWPALRAGDRLLVNRFAYRFSAPRRGDIVLLRDPERPGFECIKRIVGLPGEQRARGDQQWATNVPLAGEVRKERGGSVQEVGCDRPPQKTQYPQNSRIPAGHYFVLGDNRAFSRDSRRFGPVHRSALLGRAWRRYRVAGSR